MLMVTGKRGKPGTTYESLAAAVECCKKSGVGAAKRVANARDRSPLPPCKFCKYVNTSGMIHKSLLRHGIITPMAIHQIQIRCVLTKIRVSRRQDKRPLLCQLKAIEQVGVSFQPHGLLHTMFRVISCLMES